MRLLEKLVTMGIIDEKAVNLANEIDDLFWKMLILLIQSGVGAL